MKDGILLLRKEAGMSSYDVIRALKKKFHPRKIGHAGTLDPFASGLLIIGINEGTKILPFIESEYKEYIAKLTFGEDRDTFDITGKVVKSKKAKTHTREEIEEAFHSFLGEIVQTPPIYSAIKLNGKPLYKYARENKKIEVKPRPQYIYDLKLISIDKSSITFYVKCNKGTYIRSLGVDIAHKLGECGYLSNLERIGIGNFYILSSKKIDCIEERHLISIEDALTIKKVAVKDDKKIINGNPIKLDVKDDLVLITYKHRALAIYELNKKDMMYYCKRGFHYEDI